MRERAQLRQRKERSGRADQRAAEDQREVAHDVDVDSGGIGGFGVLADGAQAQPEGGAIEQPADHRHEQQRQPRDRVLAEDGFKRLCPSRIVICGNA